MAMVQPEESRLLSEQEKEAYELRRRTDEANGNTVEDVFCVMLVMLT